MDSIDKEVETEFLPFFRVYKDGSVERLLGSPFVPPSPEDPETGVSSKDITISQNPPISARLFRPKHTQPNQKLPILVYFHGGAFCIESAFSSDHHQYLNSLVSQGQVVAVSVEYRLAPEHCLPIAYDDGWAALQWVASHSIDNGTVEKEPWLANHGDFKRFFTGGDSAGANIVHNVTMRAGVEGLHGGVRILGAFFTHPFFLGSKPKGSENSSVEDENPSPSSFWDYIYPGAPGGIDSPVINPVVPGAPSLAGLGCSRLLVSVAEKDGLRDGGVCYYNGVKESGWKGEAELVEVEGEDHAFQIMHFGSANSKNLIKRLASFLLK
ncbi:2-hydroxyisoflavanone dehydratase-like [Juglans microcarpa x Juglans regia]|uniref:2-hydroxyisoflavanone dehydratase-like n=1 Tax=Juglans microcarpa x Juglans regia TaxID=2249226 RepID=UPI001B7F607D|nr:2-hydroxyisoflavanone dehydratase-like [Juglans microcarpa x Juglans regia]